MSFGIGVAAGAVGMLLLQFGALGAFALKEIIKSFRSSRKGMKYIEAAEEIDS